MSTNTDHSSESLLLEILTTKLARADETYKPAIVLVYAYSPAKVDDKTIKLD